MSEKAPSTGEPVRVLVKAMSVLDLLAEVSEPISLGEIAGRLDLNKSTCYRILHTLAAGDFVERHSPGTYRLGIGAFRIGSAMARRMGVRERALPAMQELYRATGETIFLLIPRGDEAVCVERLDGRYAATHTLRVGGALPLHMGAGPRLLLASLPDDQVEAYLRRLMVPTSSRHTSPTALRDQVAQIRSAGYATSEDDVEVGVRALSGAVRDHEDDVVAALSISGLTAHLPDSELDRLLDLLRTATATASQALGYRPA